MSVVKANTYYFKEKEFKVIDEFANRSVEDKKNKAKEIFTALIMRQINKTI